MKIYQIWQRCHLQIIYGQQKSDFLTPNKFKLVSESLPYWYMFQSYGVISLHEEATVVQMLENLGLSCAHWGMKMFKNFRIPGCSVKKRRPLPHLSQGTVLSIMRWGSLDIFFRIPRCFVSEDPFPSLSRNCSVKRSRDGGSFDIFFRTPGCSVLEDPPQHLSLSLGNETFKFSYCCVKTSEYMYVSFSFR